MLPQGKSTQKDKFKVDDSELPEQGEKVRPACRFIRTITIRLSQPLSRLFVPLLFGYCNPYPDYQCLNTCSDGHVAFGRLRAFQSTLEGGPQAGPRVLKTTLALR